MASVQPGGGGLRDGKEWLVRLRFLSLLLACGLSPWAVRLAAGKDTLPFRPGPREGLGSMETTASSCAPASLRAAGAVHLTEGSGLGSWEAACVAAFLALPPGAWIPAVDARRKACR